MISKTLKKQFGKIQMAAPFHEIDEKEELAGNKIKPTEFSCGIILI
jgi:hypothetical protein